MVKREVKIVAHLLLGVIALEMIIGGRVPHIDTDLQVEEAPPTAGAGPFLEIEERSLSWYINRKPSRSFSRSQ